MITSIVRGVQQKLRDYKGKERPSVEIIFPVAEEAIARGDSSDPDMSIVPGVSGGEGCSTAGGCATCPFMKMNDLDSLFEVAEAIEYDLLKDPLASFRPQQYADIIMGQNVSQVGGYPIIHMRNFMAQKRLPDDLIQDIRERTPGSGCPEARKVASL